jgi:hypothetical protein
MGATEEQMQLLSDAGVTHVSYILILYSVAFILFLCESNLRLAHHLPIYSLNSSVVNILVHIYAVHAWPSSAKYDPRRSISRSTHKSQSHSISFRGNLNGHIRTPSRAQNIRDAEEFELEGLMAASHERGRDGEDGPVDTPISGRELKDLESGDPKPL